MASPKPIRTKLWTEVDNYFAGLLAPGDAQLDAVVKANRKARLPEIDVSPLLGKLLQLLIRITQAKRVLEIGTLGAYSTICMARALPRGGRIVTLEYEPRHAEIARANLRSAGLLSRVDIRVGAALDSLPVLHAEKKGPFDFIFIDADKENNPQYLEWSLKMSRPGTVIVVDNVARHGTVIRAKSTEADIVGTRRMLRLMAKNPRLSATALQTVGVKGLDGFAIAVVLW
ncbi:MAG: O-methyltransferase [Terracidiphilus sp.]